MAAVVGIPWHKNVAEGAARTRFDDLIQNFYGILNMAFHEVKLEFHLDRRTDLLPLHWACQRPGRFWEGHVVRDGFHWGGGLPGDSAADVVLHLPVCCQQPFHQVCCTV